jgi:lipopolysaccharide export system permease protein
MAELIQITNWIVNYNINLSTILRMILYQIPYLLIFIIPLSIMITILVTFLKLSSENEIMAIKSGGISIYALLVPVGALCLIGFVFTSFMTLYGQAWGRSAFRELTIQVVSASIDIGLKEQTFNENSSGVTIFVNEIDLKTKSLVDVFIEDKRQPDKVNTVIAPRGAIHKTSDNGKTYIRLFNGSIHQTNLIEKTAYAIHFDRYEINLDTQLSATQQRAKPKRAKEMSTAELRRFIKDANRQDDRYLSMLLELHRRLALPFGCFALGLIAMPLGVQSRSAKRSLGMVLGLLVFLFYYLLMSMGKVYGETGAYPPQVGVWLPNVIIGGLGMYFLIRTANERSLKLDAVSRCLQNLFSKWLR